MGWTLKSFKSNLIDSKHALLIPPSLVFMEQMKAIVLKARCIFNHTGRGLIMWLFWYWFHVLSSLMIRCDIFVSNFPIFLKKIAVLLFGFVCVVTQFWESLSISFADSIIQPAARLLPGLTVCELVLGSTLFPWLQIQVPFPTHPVRILQEQITIEVHTYNPSIW